MWTILLQGMPGGDGIGWLFAIAILGVLFFVFKAGQWYGQSRKNKSGANGG